MTYQVTAYTLRGAPVKVTVKNTSSCAAATLLAWRRLRGASQPIVRMSAQRIDG